MGFNSEISSADRLIILARTGMKALRGLRKRPFLKRARGLLLIGRNVTLSHAHNISCGKNVKFEDYAEIHGLCSHGLNFGDNVTIGRNVMIRPSSYYGGDRGYGLTMGDNSSIGPHGYVGITIGDDCWIGSNVIILDGVTIGSHVVIGAGTLVTKDVPSNTVIIDKRMRLAHTR